MRCVLDNIRNSLHNFGSLLITFYQPGKKIKSKVHLNDHFYTGISIGGFSDFGDVLVTSCAI